MTVLAPSFAFVICAIVISFARNRAWSSVLLATLMHCGVLLTTTLGMSNLRVHIEIARKQGRPEELSRPVRQETIGSSFIGAMPMLSVAVDCPENHR